MAETAPTGRVLGGRYRLTGELARGGMATVWIAEDPLLSRRVAVKILHPELGVDDALRARFRHEAVTAARLAHPGIVATYDTGDDDGLAYIVMQLVEGPTLRRIIDEHGPLPADMTARLGAEVADALAHAHRHGLVHRDVKPANVLVPSDGQVKVTDFGIAKATGDANLTRTGTVVGTARYLAPEQVSGEAVDARADLYSLGLVLYEMLTGSVPFAAETEIATAVARLTSDPPPLRSQRPDLPVHLEAVVERCLARDPAARFASADEVAAELRSGTTVPVGDAGDEAAAASPPAATARRSASRSPRQRAWPVVLLALVAVASVVAAILAVGAALDDEPGGGPGGEPGGGVEDTPAPLTIASVDDFDPAGDDEESSGSVDLVNDGNPATTWATETYASRAFGNGKPGVGLVLELTERADVVSVAVRTGGDADWSAAVYVADERGETLEDWGPPVVTREGLGADETLEVPERGGRFVLLWITNLPPDLRLEIGEVSIAG